MPRPADRVYRRCRRIHRTGRPTGGDTIPLVIRFPEVAAGQPISVSATLYLTFTRCPDQALGRVHGIYPEESVNSFRGGLAHRVFARHLGQGPIATADLEKACREEIGAAMNPSLGALGLRPSQLAAVIREVGDLYQRFKAISSDGFRDAEVFIEVEPATGLTLRGSVDAVFDDGDEVRLVDWKTGGIYEAERQLGFYALLWALDRGEIPHRVEAVSVGSGERFEATPSEETLHATAAEVAAMAGVLRRSLGDGRDQLERIGGPWCGFCPLLESCSEGAAAVRINRM